MKRIVLFLGLLLLAIPARAQYLDGLPLAPSLSSADIMPVCQGGTAGHPGTCKTYKTTLGSVLTFGLFNQSLNLGSGTLTAANAILGGATFSGPLHMGAFVIDGTNAQFTGGTLTGLTYAGGTFSGAPTFSGTPVFSTGAAMSGTFSGAHTYSGALTLSAAATALTVTNNESIGGTLTTGTGVTNGLLMSASTLSVTGTGNPAMVIKGLGTGGINFQSGATPFTGLQLTDGGASAVNTLRVTPGTTGNGVSLQAAGDSAAILNLKAGTSGTAGSVKSFAPMNVAGQFNFGTAAAYTAGTALGAVPSTNKAELYSNVALSGTVNTGGVTPYYIRFTDAMNYTIQGAAVAVIGSLEAGFGGQRNLFDMVLQKNAAATGTAANLVGGAVLRVFQEVDAGDGGTLGAPIGQYEGINEDIRCNTGDYVILCVGQESDLRIYSGTHPQYKINAVMNYGQFDAEHGLLEDATIAISAANTVENGTGKGIRMIQFGLGNANIPWDDTASIGSAIMAIKFNNLGNATTTGHATAYIDDGFKLPQLYARNKFIDNGSFYVDGLGNIASGNAYMTSTATGQSLTVSGVVEVSAVVVSGGDHAIVGNEVLDSIGGVWEVATISGSGGTAAVATVTSIRPASASSCPVSPTSATMPTSIASPTLNITCANRLGLTVQGASGTLGFYGATPIAKPTGWSAMTGTPNTGSVYDTASVTLPQLAGRVASLQAALTAAGLIGP